MILRIIFLLERVIFYQFIASGSILQGVNFKSYVLNGISESSIGQYLFLSLKTYRSFYLEDTSKKVMNANAG